MDAKTYQVAAARTDLKDYSVVDERLAAIAELMHAGMGMVTEAGEFMDTLKKFAMYGKEIDRTNLIEELGDVMWYVALGASKLGVTLGEVMDINITKLKKRYPEKFTEAAALNRDLDGERKVLET